MIRLVRILSISFSLLFLTRALADDTLTVTIQQADSLFLARNYSLLAASLNIDARKAAEMQSKLYPNPIFTADINAYDPDNDRFFHAGATGQKSFQLEQLILLGGKRKTQIDIAKTESAMAELEFRDLVLRLRFQLRSSYYKLGQQQDLIEKFNQQLARLRTLIDAYEIQAKKGNIPMKDLVRLKGVYLNLSGEKSDCIRQYAEELIQLQLLLRTDAVVKPVITRNDFPKKVKLFDEAELARQALANRPDYLLAGQVKMRADQQLSFEKRSAVPDLNVFTSYDQRGGAFNNQVNAGLSIPLPVWNRNQGNIKIARFESEQRQYELEQAQLTVKAEVNGYLSLYNRAVHDYERAEELYNDDFELTLNAMSANFSRGNIGLIDFVDFFEAYNEAISDLSKVRVQLEVTAEQLNYITGKELF